MPPVPRNIKCHIKSLSWAWHHRENRLGLQLSQFTGVLRWNGEFWTAHPDSNSRLAAADSDRATPRPRPSPSPASAAGSSARSCRAPHAATARRAPSPRLGSGPAADRSPSSTSRRSRNRNRNPSLSPCCRAPSAGCSGNPVPSDLNPPLPRPQILLRLSTNPSPNPLLIMLYPFQPPSPPKSPNPQTLLNPRWKSENLSQDPYKLRTNCSSRHGHTFSRFQQF